MHDNEANIVTTSDNRTFAKARALRSRLCIETCIYAQIEKCFNAAALEHCIFKFALGLYLVGF